MSRSRKPRYTKSKAIDRTCRGRGGCPWCVGNRTHANAQRIMAAKQQIVEAAIEWGDTDVDDELGALAAQIGMSLWIGELDAANKNEPFKLADALKPKRI